MQIKQIPLHGSLHRRLHRIPLLLHGLAPSHMSCRLRRGPGGLVDPVPLVERLGLHGGDAGEDGEDLGVSRRGDGGVEEELVHFSWMKEGVFLDG